MKRFMTILIAAAVSLPAMVQAAEKLDYTVNVDYSTLEVDTVVHSSGEKFVRLDIAGLDNMAETNEPTLPVRLLTFEVPTYVNNFSVKLNSYTIFGTRTLPLALAPMECLTTNEAIEGVSNPVVYGAGYSATPTAPTAEVVDEYFVDGLRHFVTVRVTPVLYTHATKSVKLCNRLSVSLAYDDCNAADMKFTPIKVAKGVQFAHRIDDSTLAATSSRRVNARAASGTLEPQIKEYLILTPDSLKEGVARLVAWKRQKGYNVKVQTFESIYSMPNYAVGSNANCFDEAASVREWMKKYYADNGAFYCLIIGDYRTSAPIRKFYRSKDNDIIPYESDPNHDYYIPSDVYFADLVTKDWHMEKTIAGIYSQHILYTPISPTIYTGRLLCSTRTHIDNFIDKVILYEAYPGKGDSSYLNNALKVKHQDAKNYSIFGGGISIFDVVDSYNLTVIEANDSTDFETLRPTAQQVLKEMNKNGIYSILCHGAPDVITLASLYPNPGSNRARGLKAMSDYNPNSWTFPEKNAGLDRLTNFDSPSIAFSIACTIAPFDEVTAMRTHEYNMVSAFTCAGKFGGPLFITNTRPGSWGGSNFIEAEIGKYIKQNYSIGYSMSQSQIKNSLSKNLRFTINIIGDPELKIWLHAPAKLATAKATFSNGTLTLTNFKSKANSFGIRCGNSSYIGTFNIAGNQSVFLPDFVSFKPNSIVSVYIQTPEYLPETILIPIGDKLAGVREHYVLNNLCLGSDIKTAVPVTYDPINLNLGYGCDLSLFVYNSVTSHNGITVDGKSTLSIESEKNVVLKGDKVSNGGILNVTADTLTLKEGFEIAKGSTFDFHNR